MEKNKSKMVKKIIRPKKKMVRTTGRRFGAVSTINTAPVAIGNSVRGATLSSIRSKNGAVVTGRDFMFTPIGTTVTNWVTCGGTPLTPAAFVDSKIRSYLQLYQKYRWKRCVVHYITSSATSTSGDVLFYHAKNRNSVYISTSSSVLLPFVMSDPDTVLGPQWSNHSTELKVQGTWKSTDYGMSDNVNDYSDGEVFLLSKTNLNETPGYILFDYEVEFAEEQVAPRLLSLPIARIQYNNVAFSSVAFTTGVDQIFKLAPSVLAQPNLSGKASTMPSSTATGDIYKISVDTVNGAVAPSTGYADIIKLKSSSGVNRTIVIEDGFTCYGLWDGTNMTFYPNATAAYSDSDAFLFKDSIATPTSIVLQCWISLVGQSNADNLNPNFD
jgi:hypothetical protein